MKLKTKKTLSLLAVLVLVISALSLGAFASTDRRVTAVRFDPANVNTDPDKTVYLSIISTPSDISAELSGAEVKSSNTDVAWAGLSGDQVVIEAYNPGTCTVTLKLSGSSVSCTASVTVSGTPSSDYSSSTKGVDEDSSALLTWRNDSSRRSTASSSSSSKTGSTQKKDTITLTDKAPRTEVIAAAKSGDTLDNYDSVSTESLQAASGTVRFATKLNDATVGTLSIDPKKFADLTGDIQTGVYAGTGNTQKVQNTFSKNFSNDLAIILCDQKDFGANVTIKAKAGDIEPGSTDLYFYKYNESTKKYSPITASNASVDKNGNVTFTTRTGGYIIVSDGKLTRK